MTMSLPLGETGELFAALHNAQQTAQAQIERFHSQMNLVKQLASCTDDPAHLHKLGEISVILHTVYTMLFGPAPATPSQTPAEETPSAGATEDASSAFAEFSALLQASQSRSRDVDTLLSQSEWQLNQLRPTLV